MNVVENKFVLHTNPKQQLFFVQNIHVALYCILIVQFKAMFGKPFTQAVHTIVGITFQTKIKAVHTLVGITFQTKVKPIKYKCA